MGPTLESKLAKQVLTFQRNEITEYHIYRKLARIARNEANRVVLERIAEDEFRHYEFWKQLTGRDIKPSAWRKWKYYWIARLFGLTFGVKLLERCECAAERTYKTLDESLSGAAAHVASDENEHENKLLSLIDEELLHYTGSIVLGLNDALVELTGALAGFTLALQDARLIALTGSITGIAAAFSMAASEYLSTRAERSERNPIKASLYTGIAYLSTVTALILPFLFLSNYYLSLVFTMGAAVLIIMAFNYYICIACDLPFRRRFLEMAGLSFGVATLTFAVGFVMRRLFGVSLG